MNDAEINTWLRERRYFFMALSEAGFTQVATGEVRITNYPAEALLLSYEQDLTRDCVLFKFLHRDAAPTRLGCDPEVRAFTFEERKKVNFELPEWNYINGKSNLGVEKINPLEEFIWSQEPAGLKESEFRDKLKAAIEFVLKEYQHG